MSRLLLAALTCVLLLPGVAAACPVNDGPEVDFAYTGSVEQVQVPAGVVKMEVYARGGHGGKESDTAQGGQGGTVLATLPVAPGDCLHVSVGGYGGGHGGWGYGRGGEHGTTPYAGYDGAGGGGATAIERGGHPLVVAGGGGGGGGGSEFAHLHPGGVGGDGANGDGPGTANGSDGFNPPLYIENYIGGEGGVMDGRNGADGGPTSVYGIFTGAGGAGGGGHRGGAGGIGVPVESDQKFSIIRGGGGGGGGSSYTAGNATGVSFGVEGLSCPDGGQPDCPGEVTLRWVEKPGRIAAYGGSGQSTVIGTRYPRPLQALVTSDSGVPVPEVEVTFTLPATGPSAEFDEGAPSRTATVTTDDRGMATSPPLLAGHQGGGWSATAVAQGVSKPAMFALHNAAAPTMLALFSPANPSVTGEPVRFSAAVGASPAAAGTPTGAVEFVVDGIPVGMPVPLDAAGIAQSDPVLLPAGDHTIEASFDGQPDFAHSDGATTQRVQLATSAVELRSSANPAPAGDPVTFTADVSAAPPATGVPTGTVQFRVDGANLGGPVALAGGSATTPPISDLVAGPHDVEAIYSGDAGFEGGGATLTQAIGDGLTATEVAVPGGPTAFGEPIGVTATVTSTEPGTPTGSVTFSVGGTDVCPDVTLDGAGQAECELPGTSDPGTIDILATYSGDGDHAGSDGTARHRVVRARTSVTVDAVPDPAVFGAELLVHADVAVQGPGAGTPGGAVQFFLDGLPVGLPAALGPDGATADAITRLGAGPHVIEAEYGGDARFWGSGTQRPVTVDPAEVAATLSSSAPAATTGTPITFTAGVAAIAPGGGTPDGTVRFSVDGVPRGLPVRVRDGAASSEPMTLPAGVHDVRASFEADEDWVDAEATLEQTVSPPAPGPGPAPEPPIAPPSDGGALDPLTPLTPVTPQPSRASLCGEPFVVTRLGRRGERVQVAGRAQPELAGRRVAVLHRGVRLVRATVEADGRFHGEGRAPAGDELRHAHVRVRVGEHRIARMPLRRSLHLGRAVADGTDRLRLAIRGPARAEVVLEGRLRCGQAEQELQRVRLDRRGRASVAVVRPAAGGDDAVYRVRHTGRTRGASLPFVVPAG